MITLSKGGAYLIGGTEVVETGAGSEELLKNKLGDKYKRRCCKEYYGIWYFERTQHIRQHGQASD